MGLFGRDEKDPKEPAKDPLKDYRPAENRPQSFEPKTDPKTVTMGQAHVTPAQPPAATAAKEPRCRTERKSTAVKATSRPT